MLCMYAYVHYISYFENYKYYTIHVLSNILMYLCFIDHIKYKPLWKSWGGYW